MPRMVTPAARIDAWLEARGWYVVALLQPLTLLWWLIPGLSGMTIGSDYPVFAIEHQLELLYSVSTGTYPLYVPGLHGGQSAAALSTGGLHHPIAWVCGLMPGYWQGHALAWNTLFRMLSLGLTQLALWRALRGLGLPRWLGWLLSTLLLYNLRSLDLLRLGAPFEAWTGLWLVVAAACWLWVDRGSRWAPPSLALATGWLLGSGHPSYTVVASLGAAALVLTLPWLVPSAPDRRAETWPGPLAFQLRAAGYAALGGALVASLWLPYLWDVLGTGCEGVEHSLDWTLRYADTPAGVLASLVLPLRADVHGAFGGSSLLLAGLLLPGSRWLGLRFGRTSWLWLALLLVVMALLMGRATPLHGWLWSGLPSLRPFLEPGMLALLVPVLLLPLALLAWRTWREAESERARRGLLLPLGLAALLQLLAPWIWSAWSPAHTRTSPFVIQNVSWAYELALAGLGLLALAALGGLILQRHWRWLGALLAVLVLAQAGLSLARGTWVEAAKPTPTRAELADRKRSELTVFGPGHDAWQQLGQARVTAHKAFIGPLPRPLARLCTAPRAAVSRDHAYQRLLEEDEEPGSCVIEGRMRDRTGAPEGAIQLVEATYNHQRLEVETPVDSWLIVHHPFDGRWSAELDGVPTALRRADGVQLALPVPAGSHRVALRYHSAAWSMGAGISSLALALIGLLASLALSGRLRLAGAALSLLVPSTLVLGWWASLDGGHSLEAAYRWEAGQASIPALSPELERPEPPCRILDGLRLACPR